MTQSFFNYLEFEKRYSSHTIKAYQIDLRQFEDYLISSYDPVSLESARQKHVRSWMVDLFNKNLTAKSVNRKLSTVKSFFGFLRRKEVRAENPAINIVAPKLPFQLPKTIDEKSIDRLLEQYHFGNDFEGYRNRLIVELLYETGMRISELIHLKCGDVDVINKSLNIVGKGNKERCLTFSNKLQFTYEYYLNLRSEMLLEIETISPDYLLLTKKAKKIYPKLVHRLLSKVLGAVTTSQNKNPHTIRHTFATMLLNNGADLNAIKELLGHSSLAATQVYTHNSIEKMKKIYKKAHPRDITREERVN